MGRHRGRKLVDAEEQAADVEWGALGMEDWPGKLALAERAPQRDWSPTRKELWERRRAWVNARMEEEGGVVG